jgi:hypothetical protein
MRQALQMLTRRHVNVLAVLLVLAVVSSILFYSGCAMSSRGPNIPPNPTPTPTPTPTPDTLRPTSTITSPTAGATVLTGTTVNITGTASDTGGGSVVRVEVSVDGGATFSTAAGTNPWSFNWTPTSPGPATIRSRAVDNSGNVQDPTTVIAVTVANPPDTTPPTVTSFSPAAGAVNVSPETNVIVTFSEAMDPASVNGASVNLLGPNGLVSATVSYDAASFTATLNPAASLVDGVTYTPRVRGGSADPRVKDVAGNALAADLTWTFTTTPMPPEVVSTLPAPGATNVPLGVAPVATFSEALDDTSLSASTVVLRDDKNNLIPARISYVENDLTVTLTPQQSLQPGQTYTVYLKGGPTAPHITDEVGTPLAADFTWSFTIATPALPITNLSIWSPTDEPSNTTANEPEVAVELGMKFRSDIDGQITGVRFYKVGPADSGEHVGHLWTSDGTLLGSVTFANETPSGWQQALFQTPIPIVANTTYVVSYFAPRGFYVADVNYFASSGVDDGPLHALSNALAGGNGVFQYDPPGGFPTQTSNSTNYWVDAVFNDPTPPLVVRVTPGAGVLTGVTLAATFSEPMDITSLNASTIQVRDPSNNPVPVSISYSQGAFTLTLELQQLLIPDQMYTVTLRGGPDSPQITNVAGTPLAADFTWPFKITPFSPLPDRPILVITGEANAFTAYYREILRAEGFNNFNSLHISGVTAQALAQHDVAILSEMPLTSTRAAMLIDWVDAGGKLIAMRPDKQLASLLGLNDAASVLSDAYLLVNTAQEPGAGIVGQTIQYHSAADLYELVDATPVATIWSSPTQATSNPAVTLRSVGTNGGQAAAFTFDLARSIVFTRQGNPDWAGQERDGFAPKRPNDLFFGGAVPDYVNLDKVAIPQADELQRLLGNMILFMNMDRRPLPRFWYLPDMKKAVVLMTSDDHGTQDGTKTIFDRLTVESPQGCRVNNWECFRATSWLYTSSGLTNSQAIVYHKQGFEMGVHVNTNCEDWTPQTLNSFFTNDLASFAAKYTSLPAQKTNRTHCVPWSDWATHPKVELDHGIRLDENYYYWPPSWVQNRPGFMTGSGFPMRFADLDGLIINVYQATTHLTNQTDNTPNSVNSMLDKALGPEGYYGVFGTHYDFNDNFQLQLLESAKARNVPLISADQLLTWLDGRNASSLGNLTWNGTQLEFSISIGAGANNLFAMIPNQTTGGQLNSLTINGAPVSFTVETLKGRSYAVFRAANGNVLATYAP